MQQLGFHVRIRAHGERQLSLWAGQAACVLYDLASQSAELLKEPQRCALFGGVTLPFMTEHLYFPVEIVRQHGREQKGLVTSPGARGHVVHLCLRLELGKYAFLGATTIVESQCFLGGNRLVGHDDLEVIAIFIRAEQIQLDQAFVLFSVLSAYEDEAVARIPARGFPVRLEEAALPVEVTPAFPVFDQRLECAKAFEWHADGELHAFGIKHGDDVIAEKGAVHARLDDAARQNGPDFPDTGENERPGAVGVVHVTGPMPDVEHLSGLGDGAEEGVIAAASFLLAVEADGRAFGETSVGKHGAVEVQRDPGKLQSTKLIQNPLPDQSAQVGDTGVIQSRQRPADGGDIRQALQPQQAMHHRVIPVVAHILQSAVTQQEMSDQQQYHHAVAEDRADLQMTETSVQLLLQSDAGKQRLVNHKTGKRGQALVFEPNLGNAMRFTMSGRFATLHMNGLRWFYWLFWRLQFYQLRDRFLIAEDHLLAFLYAAFWTSLLVKFCGNRMSGASSFIQAVSLENGTRFMQLSGYINPATKY